MFIKLYNFLITTSYPLIIKRYIEKRKKNGKEDLARFNERIGQPTTKRPEGKLIWLHGASVGESVSMLPLINKLLEAYKDAHIMVTTGTITSADVMAKRLPKRCFHQYFTIDKPEFTNKFINHWKPDMVLWFESDFWPAMISTIKKNNIPLILVNGRISNKSFAKWKTFKFISKQILDCFTFCLGQSEEDAARLRQMGAKDATYLGNLKFAGLPQPINKEEKQKMQNAFKGRAIWLASSTHSDEEFKAATIHKNLKEKHENLLTVIAPRHPNRGPEIKEKIVSELGLTTSLRSENEDITALTDVYIANTIGELGMWYDLFDIVFIGGSLIPHGGQNFMEPSREHCAVVVGPHMHNFTDAMNKARKANAVTEIKDVAELEATVLELLDDKNILKQKQEASYNWAMSEAKVVDGIVDKVKEFLA